MNKKEEIFTIGDKTTLGIITCFRLLDNEIMVDFDNKNSILLKSKQLQHSKKPLFRTEDGVDIFKGDKVYYVETDDEPENLFKVNEYTVQYSGRFTSDNTLHSFSTKEKAEEYILMNKPCLSINDILKILPKYISLAEARYLELEKLVKTKLKND